MDPDKTTSRFFLLSETKNLSFAKFAVTQVHPPQFHETFSHILSSESLSSASTRNCRTTCVCVCVVFVLFVLSIVTAGTQAAVLI